MPPRSSFRDPVAARDGVPQGQPGAGVRAGGGVPVPLPSRRSIAVIRRVGCADAASSHRRTSVPQVYSSSVVGSDLVTVAGKSCRTSPSTMVRVASPVIVRSRLARNGAQRASWSGSVSAAHTFVGGCRRSREKIRVQRSPAERTATSASGPGSMTVVVHFSSLSGLVRSRSRAASRDDVRGRPNAATTVAGTARAIGRRPRIAASRDDRSAAAPRCGRRQNPASRNTFRCLETVGWLSPSESTRPPTLDSDVRSSSRIRWRVGSASVAKAVTVMSASIPSARIYVSRDDKWRSQR